jgi:hypothetical protein
MKKITLKCEKCGKKFERSASLYKSDINRGRSKVFCSKLCIGITGMPPLKTKCNNCGKEIIKTLKDAKKSLSGKHYCSISCCVSNNNKRRLNKSKIRICTSCGSTFNKCRTTRCTNCLKKWYNRLLKRKKSEVSKPNIGSHARYVAIKNNLLDKCAECGYSFHVDTCHRKAIKLFPETALIGEINSVSNLIGLCKNHHWEFDHGYLAI